MKTRLYRFTPHGGKPEHFTHDHSSAVRLGAPHEQLAALPVGGALAGNEVVRAGTWERVA